MALCSPGEISSTPNVRDAALQAHARGLSVLPPHEDGTKSPLAPDGTWKRFQAERASLDELHRWYGTKGPPKRTGLGAVTGAVSGGLSLFEFDCRATYLKFKEAAAALGLAELVERIEAGYLEDTPGGGVHWLVTCEGTREGTKLARRHKTPDEFTDADREAIEAARAKGREHRPFKTLIETKDEGGYVVLAPSNGKVHPSGGAYRLLRGGFATMAAVTPAELESLWGLARSFDRMPEPEPAGTKAHKKQAGARGDTVPPWEDYNARTTWSEVLPAGWVMVHQQGETEYWRRPGKDRGHSATINHDGSDRLYVFSSSTEFDPGRPYDRCDVYAALNHGGDCKAAYKALSDLGFGTFQAWVWDREKEEWRSQPHPNPCPPGGLVRIAKQGEGPPPPPRGGEGKATAEGPEPGANGPITPNESADDPSRLARLFLRKNHHHEEGFTLRFWQGDYVEWDGAYRPAMAEDVRARLHPVIKAEFDRLNVEAIARWKKGPKPRARKVTGALVSNATLALSGYTRLEPRTPQPAWLAGPVPFPAEGVLPARNALVYLPGLVAREPGAIHPPTPRFFCPYALDYDFDLSAPEPARWFAFLDSLWGEDLESIATLQEWFGLLLTPDTSHQKILMMIGPKRSGRGTIARVIKALLGGENVANPTLSSLATNFGLAPLIGKPAAIITDARLSNRTDVVQVVERLLSISGEDGQTIDRKHLPAVTVKLPTRFTLISNELPRLMDTSGALAGRLILLRLTRSFFGAEDRGLTAALLQELPGILLWAILGWQRLRDRGRFIQPKSGMEMVEQMGDLASPVGMFVRECCAIAPDLRIPVSDLFAEWKQWCLAKNREHVGDEPTFGRNLRSVIPTLETKPVRRNGKWERDFHGIAMAPPVSF